MPPVCRGAWPHGAVVLATSTTRDVDLNQVVLKRSALFDVWSKAHFLALFFFR